MPVNIKNDRVSHLVSELSETTGLSITDAVGQAGGGEAREPQGEVCPTGNCGQVDEFVAQLR